MLGNAWRQPSALPEFDRLRDVAVASALLLLFLPLMLFVSIAIKADSRGHVLRWDLRTGPGGNRFRACRFRTTVLRGEMTCFPGDPQRPFFLE